MSETFSGQVDIFRTPDPNTVSDPSLPAPSAVIRLDGDTGDISAGGRGRDGDLVLRSAPGFETVKMDGQQANLRMGGAGGTDGDILLFPSSGDLTNDSTATIHLNANAGDIILRNADCAEDFDVSSTEPSIEPGSVVVLGDDERLRLGRKPYDRKVAGVVSGAGDLRPALVLDKQPERGRRVPIGLVGKVYCKVDAGHGAIEVGDLLTTSPTPGHAMKATDAASAFGAVLGKALRACPEGRGLIPILIAMQ